MFVYFTDKDNGISIAVNPDNVYCIKETGYGTTICFVNNVYIVVTESYLDVVARLNTL
jgi:uncharacterized protein YlzI (FlbEa/FlbD family)